MISEAGETANSRGSQCDSAGRLAGARGKLQLSALCGDDVDTFRSTVSGATYNGPDPTVWVDNQNPSVVTADQDASGNYNVTATVGGLTSAPGTTAVTVNPRWFFRLNCQPAPVLTWPFGALESATNVLGVEQYQRSRFAFYKHAWWAATILPDPLAVTAQLIPLPANNQYEYENDFDGAKQMCSLSRRWMACRRGTALPLAVGILAGCGF